MTILRTVFALGLGLLVCGCGGKNADRPAVHPVSGVLRIGGNPAVDARVVLYPVGGPEKPLVRPHATVASDGSFRLTTFATRDGAPVGDFAVTVTLPGPRAKGQGEDEEGPDRLQGRYSDPKKPAASVHIAAETTELAAIDLKPVEEKPAKSVAPQTGIEP